MSKLKSQFDMGDLRFVLKFRALQQEKHWLGLAITPYVTFPTGDEERFLGEGRFTVGGTLTLEHDFKAINVALNGGYLYRGPGEVGTIAVGDAWKVGAGISRAFDNGLSFSIEYFASFYASEDDERFQGNPMEAMATLRYSFGKNMPRLVFGGSGGITGGVGCPKWRGTAGLDYYHCRVPKPKPVPTQGELAVKVVDQAGDPLVADVTVAGPASFTGTTDARGRWEAPGKVAPGEYTASASKDCHVAGSATGVVEVAKKTTIVVTLAKVPTRLTVRVVDKYTGAKLDAHVVFDQGAKDEQSLVVPRGEWTADWKAGSYKMIVSAKGYEDVFTDVTVATCADTVKKVELRKVIPTIDNIYFDYDSDVIRKVSYATLDDVVAKIKGLGQFKRIIVQGHCSSEGTDAYNMDLSTRRANSVKKYLSKKGIPAAKIDVEAYGESRPLATNDTEEGRAKNRRVMFIIEEQ
jgi:outer membrane protein OmpA-like peptidoglycan-associated protein